MSDAAPVFVRNIASCFEVIQMKSKLYLSLFLGAVFGLISACILFFLDRFLIRLAFLAGGLFALSIFLVIVMNEKILRKRYENAEKAFSKEIRQTENANIRLGGKVRNGNLYLFEDELLILCLDGKPTWTIPVPYSEIRSLELAKEWELVLRTDSTEITATTVNAEALREKIRQMSDDNPAEEKN